MTRKPAAAMNRPGARLGQCRWLGGAAVACTGWVAGPGGPLGPPPVLLGPPGGFRVVVPAIVVVPTPGVGPPPVPAPGPGPPPTAGPPGEARSAPQWGQNRKSGGTSCPHRPQ